MSERSPFIQRVITRFVLRSLICFAAAAGVRLFFVFLAPFVSGDTIEYHRIATNLAAGNGYAQFEGVPTVVRPPVYPLLMAGVYAAGGPHPGLVLGAQAMIGGITAWLIYALARRHASETVAMSAGLLAGTYPHLAFYSATVLSETVAAFFLVLATLFASHAIDESRKAALLCGIAGGAAALSAPYMLALPLALAGAIGLARPERWRGPVLAVAIGVAAAFIPWVGRNVVTFGSFVPITVGQSGISFWSSANRIPMYDYKGVFVDAPRTEPLVSRWLELYHEHPETERERFAEHVELDRALIAAGIEALAREPAAFAAYRIRTLPAQWMQPAIFASEHSFRPPLERQNEELRAMLSHGHLGDAAVRVLTTLVYVGGLYGGLLLLAVGRSTSVRDHQLFWLPAVAMLLATIPVWSEYRYTVASHLLLWVLGSAGWMIGLARLRRLRSST